MVGAAGGVLPSHAIDYDKPVPGSEKLTAYQYGGMILIRWNNAVLCGYRGDPTQKYPYFHVVAGALSGLPMTTESALPYPHHRGLWLGMEPLNGGDYWGDSELSRGQIRSTGIRLVESAPTRVRFVNRCEWVRQGAASPLEEERTFTITMHEPGRLWTLDAAIRLSACEDLEVRSAKHSLFALRVAAELAPIYGGVMANNLGGVNAEGVHGKPAAWAGYSGRRAAAGGAVEGIAIFDHPQNPWNPCPWMARDYGHLSPSPFGFLERPWRLEKGNSLWLRYRVAVHAGDARAAGLNGLYKAWISAS